MEGIQDLLEQYGNNRLLPTTPKWWSVDENNLTHVNIPVLGQTVINNNDIAYITNGEKETLYYYLGDLHGYWRKTPTSYINQIVGKELDKQLGAWSAKREKDTVQYIQSHARRITAKESIYKAHPNKFNFKNAVFDWQSMKLIPHSKDYYFTSASGTALNTQNLDTPMLEKWFNLSFGENAQTMKEFIGYIFYGTHSPINAFVVLLGNGNDGKSTFINRWLIPTVGNDNVAGISLGDLAGKNISEFKLSELQGKYLNAHSENSETPINDTARLKMLTGGDRVNASVKGKDDIVFINNAKMLFATNNLPSFRDNTNGMKRRIIVINFNRIENFDDVIDFNQVKEETPMFIYKCLEVAKKAIERKSFTITNSIQKANSDWLEDNDPIEGFLKENIEINPNIETPRDQIYNAYCNYCELNGYKYCSSRKFFKDLRDNKGIKETIRGRRRKYYIDVQLTTGISTVHPKDRTKQK